MMPLGNEYAIEFNPPDLSRVDVPYAQLRCRMSEFTPFVPRSTTRDYSTPPFGLTVRPDPVFWFQISQNMTEMYFEISEYDTEGRGKDSELIYETSLDLSGKDGIIRVPVPLDIALETGMTYQWYIHVWVGRESIDSHQKSGWIERVEVSPELSNQLARAQTSLDRARVYAEAGIWHDAFDILTQERYWVDTPELKAEWEELLQSVFGESIPLPKFYEVSKCL